MLQSANFKYSIKKNDLVEVISGREKGKSGKVLELDQKNARVIVEKVNMIKRHVKPSQKYPQGGVIEKESSIHYSNILLMCPKCNRGVRHGHKMMEQSAGKKTKKSETAANKKMMKVRVCKRCGEALDTAA